MDEGRGGAPFACLPIMGIACLPIMGIACLPIMAVHGHCMFANNGRATTFLVDVY